MSDQTSTAPAAINLADLLKPTTKSAWVDFKEGISFEICYVSKSKFKSITDQCTHLQYDPRSKVHQPKVDTVKLVDLFVREAVKGWKGVTPKRLANISPLNLEALTKEQLDMEIPYSHEQLTAIIKETYELDTFLQEAATDIRCFSTSSVPKEDAAKN